MMEILIGIELISGQREVAVPCLKQKEYSSSCHLNLGLPPE